MNSEDRPRPCGPDCGKSRAKGVQLVAPRFRPREIARWLNRCITEYERRIMKAAGILRLSDDRTVGLVV